MLRKGERGEDPEDRGDAHPKVQQVQALAGEEEEGVGGQFLSGTSRRGMGEVRGPSGDGGQQGGGPGNMAAGVDCEPGLCVDSQHITQISALEPGSGRESSDVLASSRPLRKRKRTPAGSMATLLMQAPPLGHISVSQIGP